MTLRLNGSTSGYVEIDSQAVGGNNTIQLPTSNGSANQFLKNGSTAGTLGWSSVSEDTSGRFLVGTSSGFAVTHSLNVFRSNTAVGIGTDSGTGLEAVRFYNGSTAVGTISTTAAATAYNTSSDYRLKENVTPVTDSITRLQQLKPSRFNFIADPDRTVDGFIAHEVQAVVPEAITGEKDAEDADGNPIYQGIDQSKLVPLLTAALQEAVAKIASLEARLTALEAAQ